MSELIGRIQDTSSGTLSDLVLNEKRENTLSGLLYWIDIIKTFISVSTLLSAVAGIIYLCYRCSTFGKIQTLTASLKRKRKEPEDTEEKEMATLTPLIQQEITSSPQIAAGSTRMSTSRLYSVISRPATAPMAPASNREHSHQKCTYTEGKELMWEDGCPCPAAP